jgi:hypothetical protein
MTFSVHFPGNTGPDGRSDRKRGYEYHSILWSRKRIKLTKSRNQWFACKFLSGGCDRHPKFVNCSEYLLGRVSFCRDLGHFGQDFARTQCLTFAGSVFRVLGPHRYGHDGCFAARAFDGIPNI